MSRLIDLSQEIAAGMPIYPGDEPVELTQVKCLDRDWHTNHRLVITMHAGTHIDSPMHLLPSRTYISQLPLESFVAAGSLLDVRGQAVIRWRPEYEQAVKPGSIVLLYTGYDGCYGSDRYYQDHPCVEPQFCDFLLQRRVKMLGMDLPSPDHPPFPVHKRLLANGVYILENLTNLDQLLAAGNFTVMALPLRIRADGSPARVVAKTM